LAQAAKVVQTKSKARRHEAILAELRATPAIRIVELAGTHGVSTETIRRDLDELGAAGLISRTYGGATGAPLASEPLLDERYRTNQAQRLVLAKATVPLIRDGDSLMIDAGATTIYVAGRLAAERQDLTVVTNSFGVASALAANPTFRIRVCPGEYDPRDGGVGGPDTISYLSQFHVTHAVTSATRLDENGPSDVNSASVSIKRIMIKQAAQTILVLDRDKLDRPAFERICPLSEIDRLVTDHALPAALAKALKKAKVSVHLP
jgi:DeoR/GlpR family transcriptional regulator of sugar metabolism